MQVIAQERQLVANYYQKTDRMLMASGSSTVNAEGMNPYSLIQRFTAQGITACNEYHSLQFY